ncbi:Uncharacterised protein [Vibrio cholerae]|nr:Uncharacterised protein [Vibrio cholerae]
MIQCLQRSARSLIVHGWHYSHFKLTAARFLHNCQSANHTL